MKKIIIIGGGIGGLCTAIALQQYGFEVKVYEKAKNLGDVGAGLSCRTSFKPSRSNSSLFPFTQSGAVLRGTLYRLFNSCASQSARVFDSVQDERLNTIGMG